MFPMTHKNIKKNLNEIYRVTMWIICKVYDPINDICYY